MRKFNVCVEISFENTSLELLMSTMLTLLENSTSPFLVLVSADFSLLLLSPVAQPAAAANAATKSRRRFEGLILEMQ